MSRFNEDTQRITFPKVASLRPLDSQDVATGDLQSVVSSECSTEKKTRRNRMDIADSAGCLITNIHRHSDQMAHWLNAQRLDSEEKKEVERALTLLGVVPVEFHLNDISNLSWLDASLHIGFDKYDLFAVTAELESCKKLKEFLIDDFNRRQNEVDRGGPMRFRVYKPLTISVKLQFVPLHPQQLCPRKFPLLRRNDGSDTYRFYIACNDGLFRETTDPENTTSPPFPAFEQPTTRTESEVLNIWLVMLNAESKFSRYIRNYGQEAMHPDMRPVAQATIEIVDLIYKKLDGRSSLPTRQSARVRTVVKYTEPSGSESETETETETGPSDKTGAYRRAEKGEFMQVDPDITKWARDLLNRPGRPSLSDIYNQVSSEEGKAICQEFFFGRDADEDERREREPSQYATDPATFQHWRQGVET